MPSALSKTSVQSLSKILVIAFVLSLVSGLLNPIAAKATPFGNDVIDSAPINLTATKPSAFSYAGDLQDPTITVSRGFQQFPSIPPYDYYYAHLYNIDTGKHVSSDEITSSSTSTLNFPQLIPVGINNYQVILTHGTDSNAADDIRDLDNVIGKSSSFSYERKPIAIKLEAPEPYFGEHGTALKYEVNQEINDSAYAVQVFNTTTGKLEFSYTDRVNDWIGVMFPYDESNSYIAVLAKQELIDGWYQPRSNLNDVTDIIATSNIVSLHRKPWKVEIQGDGWGVSSGYMKVNVTAGGGEYATYLVNNSTGQIIWDSEAPEEVLDAGIENPTYPDTSWATAYVARSYKERNSGEPVFDKPQTYNDLTDIIANSNGYSKQSAGVADPKQIAGGTNPDSDCSSECHGDPINTSTGEFFDHKVDIEAVGTGLIPSVERSFSTINKDTLNLLGYGWRTNYEMKIVSDSSNENYDPNILTSRVILMENENSSVSSFYRKDDGSFEGSTQTRAALSYDPVTQTFNYIRDNEEIYTFNSAGKLIRIENDQNQIVTLTYQNGKLHTVSDTRGNALTFAYNANNLISTVTAQNGKVTTYTYGTNKQVAKVVNAEGVTFNYTYDTSKRVKTLSNELGGVTTNTYNASHQVTRQVDPLGRIMTFVYSGNLQAGTTQIKYPNLKVIEETYLRGQLTKKVENFGKANALTWTYAYDGMNKLVSLVNPDLTSNSRVYDNQGNLVTSIDGNGNSITFAYDSSDNLLTSKDPYGNITTNVYDTNDNLISTTSPLGEKTTFTYNSDKSLASSTDARGNAVAANPADYTSTFAYLPNGLVSGVTNALSGTTSMSYNNKGDLIETEDARGYETKVEYNALGLPTKVSDPLLHETAMTYDQMGNVLTSKNAKGAITIYAYDILGNRLTVKNALNEVTTYAYNSMNQPTTITLANGTVQTITYDIFGRPTELKDQLLRVTKQEWDSNSRLTASINPEAGRTEYTYDAAGNLKTMKTPIGAVTSYQYDKMNRLVRVTDALGRSSSTEYDANGKVTKTTAADGTAEQTAYDAVGNVTQTKDETGTAKTYAYDALNRKISATNELGQVTSYSYDAASNLVSQTRPDNSMVGYTYDARNLLLSIDYQGTAEDIAYTYDELGRKVTEKKGAEPTVNYSYDSLNRVISRGAANNLVGYAYDSVGNLLSLTYPSGRVVTYGYDAAAQLTQLNTTGVGATSFGYNNRSLQTATTLANGVIESKAYDADSQLLSMELVKGATSLYKRTQSYNLVGDVTQRGTSSNGAPLTLENFTYDPVSRLTEHKSESNEQTLNSYGYNTVGNLIAVGNKNQTYDAVGKVTATGSTDVTYDARNNRTALIDTVDATNNVGYTWAQNNLLASVTAHDDTTIKTVAYTYGAENLLQTRTEGALTEQFVWDTSRAIPAMLSDGKYEYVYSQDRVPLAQIEIATGNATYLHKDLTGSVTASTDSSGQLMATVDYSPYGVPTGSLLSRFGYAGEWVDSITGYSYLKARWLDTLTGTFLSEDPLVQVTNNAFGYTEGNPITQIDPLGLITLITTVDIDPLSSFKRIQYFLDNSGNISFGLGIGAASGGGPMLGVASAAVGAISYGYEDSKCNGSWQDLSNLTFGLLESRECSETNKTLALVGVAGGAAGQFITKTPAVASKLIGTVPNLDKLALYTTVLGWLPWLAANEVVDSEQDTTNEAASLKQDDTPKC